MSVFGHACHDGFLCIITSVDVILNASRITHLFLMGRREHEVDTYPVSVKAPQILLFPITAVDIAC